MTILAAALALAERGWHVYPVNGMVGGRCTCGGRDNCKPGKHPLTAHGHQDATTSKLHVARWWDRWPDANLAVALRPSGLVVVDVDGPEGADNLKRLQRRHGAFDTPLWARSGRDEDGWHAYFAAPADMTGLRASRNIAPHVEVKTLAIIAPPSVHRSGRVYRWHSKGRPAPLPDWVRRLAIPPPPRPLPTKLSRDPDKRLQALARKVRGAAESNRNNVLNWASYKARELVDAGAATADDVAVVLLDAARACHLRDDEAIRTIASGLGRPHVHRRIPA